MGRDVHSDRETCQLKYYFRYQMFKYLCFYNGKKIMGRSQWSKIGALVHCMYQCNKTNRFNMYLYTVQSSTKAIVKGLIYEVK